MNRTDLGFCSGNGHLCFRINVPDLPVHSLQHGFILAMFIPEEFDELLGSDIIGKRP